MTARKGTPLNQPSSLGMPILTNLVPSSCLFNQRCSLGMRLSTKSVPLECPFEPILFHRDGSFNQPCSPGMPISNTLFFRDVPLNQPYSLEIPLSPIPVYSISFTHINKGISSKGSNNSPYTTPVICVNYSLVHVIECDILECVGPANSSIDRGT